ncbi:MAG: glycoside hydrolase family 20 zincin-like fold domain-containing protein [Phycisphaerales bacterium JB059]
MTLPATRPPLLLPSPRRVRNIDGSPATPDTPCVERRTPALEPEAYTLTISSAQVTIESASDAGAAHARRTLEQLRAQYPDALPPLRIEDAPAFDVRAVMLDVSRSRVPTMPDLLAQARGLARLKLNHLQLYIEHAFAYRGHEVVWRDADPITPAELTSLDAACRERHITLAANQNCFGHMERWLRLPRYAHLAETHAEFDFYGMRRQGPFSLCPTDPAALSLVEDLLTQQLASVSSGLVNIGCDETADLGAGRSAEAVKRSGKTSVYLDYVNRICQIARSLGATPMLWGDIALAEPERLAELHDGAIALAWGYEPDTPFDAWGRTLNAAGRPWLACPGTSSWRSITGRTSERRANLRSAARAAHAHRAEGMLLTDWGDLGHPQQPAIAQLAIAEFAQTAWNPETPPDAEAIALHVFGDRSLRVARWLADLGDADLHLRRVSGVPASDATPTPIRNGSALFEVLHPSGAPNHPPHDPAPREAHPPPHDPKNKQKFNYS